MGIDNLEAARGGPFTILFGRRRFTLPDPADMPFQAVLAYLQAEVAPETPLMRLWHRDLVFQAWSAHYDLPAFIDAQRLAYLLDHYEGSLIYDLHHFAQLDAGELWRARRWKTMLACIDRLPGHSWYNASVSTDEEHARMLAESIAAREETDEEAPPSGPSMQTWTPEVAAINQLIDAVREVSYTVAAVQGAKPKPPEPMPRPRSLLEQAMKRAQFNSRKAKHDALAMRILPHKRRATPPVA